MEEWGFYSCSSVKHKGVTMKKEKDLIKLVIDKRFELFEEIENKVEKLLVSYYKVAGSCTNKMCDFYVEELRSHCYLTEWHTDCVNSSETFPTPGKYNKGIKVPRGHYSFVDGDERC